MKRNLLATTISGLLALSATPVFAQDAPAATTPPAEEKKTSELNRVVVTGSLIPISQQETASPVTTITAEDIQKQGYRNVADVLRAQPLATGSVQDNQFSGGFTPGATTISLLGLSPSFTLILIDGRPLADYPLLYNGQSNFTDLSSIPTAMIERIDILPGNQSAIYGSSAIAGVVNIILKKHIEGMQLGIRWGGYDDGGGENLRFQFTGGHQFGNMDLTWGLQYSKQDPIWGYDRSWYDSTNDNPNPNLRFGSRVFLILDGFTGQYIDPGVGGCDDVSGNFGGSVFRDFRPGSGFYCGSREQPGYTTFLNEESGTSAYLNGTWQFGESELYASLLYGVNETESNSGSRFWSPDINGSGGYVWNDLEGSLNLYQHIFSPEETGNANNFTTRSNSYNFSLGWRGSFGDWDYDAYYNRSQYDISDSQPWPMTDEIEDFFREQFLGEQFGTYYGYPVYHPDMAAFYQALTPEQYASFLGEIATESTTWTHNVNFQITNPSLFSLPAGDVGVAALVQAGYQSWNNPTDPAVIAGEFWGITGTQGHGKRSNQAIALEFRVPLLKSFTTTLSTRYDQYKNIDAGDDAKATWKIGLEWRPMDTLLVRGNYATAFRAPDMSYVFAGDSGFFTSVTDFFRCEEAGEEIEDCQYNGVQVQGSRSGNPDLKSITAKSWGYGFVWSPNRKFDLRADYYNVNIDEEVNDRPLSDILITENECRQGRLDANSQACIEALAAVDRNGANAPIPFGIQLIRTSPVNISKEKVAGVIAGTSYRWGGGRQGDFELSFDYNVTIDHRSTLFPGDPEIDYLRQPFESLSTEFKTVFSGDFNWQIGKWASNLHGVRYGSTPDYDSQFTPGQNHRVHPWILLNLSVNREIGENMDLSLTVNNLGNRKPPFDRTYTAYPYYNVFNYNGYGRAWWLEWRYDFGASTAD